MNNKIAIFLGHPAHFHLYRNVADYLISDGYDVTFLVKRKDILEELVQKAGYKYVVIREYVRKGSSIRDMIKAVWDTDYATFKFLMANKPRILIGSYGPWLSHISGIPVVCTGEDDVHIVPQFSKISYPFVRQIVMPITCNNGKWEYKTIHYPGFQKLAYLHPKRFTPNEEKVTQYGIDVNKPYFLVRFSGLNAFHDGGVQGISTEVAQQIIDLLSPHGQIYITSERELEPQFEQYRLHINPLDIHHVMAFATLYLGDSQSMAVEAAMLGVPSLRFNDFVGKKKIGVMEELEHVYGLTYGISSHDPEKLYAKIQELLAMGAEGLKGGEVDLHGAKIANPLREEFQARRAKMLADKIDVTAFFTWFIENYPASANEAKENKDNQEFWEKYK